MNERSFSRRRRSMRFRPSGGLGHSQPKPDRDAPQPRAEVVGGTQAPEKVYDDRHQTEIDRAENKAAGLPPDAPVKKDSDSGHHPDTAHAHADAREASPAPARRDEQKEKPFVPVHVNEQSRGLVESLKNAASTLVKKVQRLIKP